jgi:hypothetical protein
VSTNKQQNPLGRLSTYHDRHAGEGEDPGKGERAREREAKKKNEKANVKDQGSDVIENVNRSSAVGGKSQCSPRDVPDGTLSILSLAFRKLCSN